MKASAASGTLPCWPGFRTSTERLAQRRNARGLTQKDLAARIGLNQAQIHRYAKGAAGPSMSALKRLALALAVTIDELVFEEGERGPDDDLRLQFDAVSQFPPEEKRGST